MYNKIFSILTRGKGTKRKISKAYQEDESIKAIHSVLIPDGPAPFIDYAAEQIIQCIRSSYIRSSIDVFDPDNRYKYPLTFPVMFESSLSDLSDNITVSYNKRDEYAVNMEQDNYLKIDGSAKTVEFIRGDRQGEVMVYNETDGLSEPIVLNKWVSFNIKNLSTGPHYVTLSYKLPFTRSLLDIKNNLPVSVASRYEYAKYNQLPDYIAVIAMDVCYKQERI
jgi:hypothetical protein